MKYKYFITKTENQVLNLFALVLNKIDLKNGPVHLILNNANYDLVIW